MGITEPMPLDSRNTFSIALIRPQIRSEHPLGPSSGNSLQWIHTGIRDAQPALLRAIIRRNGNSPLILPPTRLDNESHLLAMR